MSAQAAVDRDVHQAVAWIRQCGGQAVVDSSTRHGMHVYVPLAESLRRDRLTHLLTLLKARLPTLDITPMLNPNTGCITPPGSPCKSGGHRRLVNMTITQAIAAFTTRSAPGLPHRLANLLDHRPLSATAANDTEDPPTDRTSAPADYKPGPAEDARIAHPSAAPLRPWVPAFLTTGTPPDLVDPSGRPFTRSHARLSILEQHAARGWSLIDIKATRHDPTWAGFWSGYAHRRDAQKRLTIDWERAYQHAEKRLSPTGQKSSQPAHKHKPTHTGGVGGLRWKLAAARKWVLMSGHFTGRQQWTALVVITALAYGISLTDGQTVATGGRWLSIASGLTGEASVWTVLRKLRSIDGSPLIYLEGWNARAHTGDRYTLVTPKLDGRTLHAAEWEAFAARIEPIDPVWSELGLAAWWCYEILRAIQPNAGESVHPNDLAAAAHISVKTVHRALVKLQDHGLVDHGWGWVAHTGRSPRRLPILTAQVDERRAARITRHRAIRAEFWAFIDLISANYHITDIPNYVSHTEPAHHPAARDIVLDRRHTPNQPPPPTPQPKPRNKQSPTHIADTHALALLQNVLGATPLATIAQRGKSPPTNSDPSRRRARKRGDHR